MSKDAPICVPSEHEGRRLDQFLACLFSERSRTFLQRLIDNERVRVNGEAVRKSYALKEDEVVTIDWPEERPFVLVREHIDFPVIYEDDHIIVINKPPDMPVHPGIGNDRGTLVNALLGYDYNGFAAMAEDTERPGIVHRLDKDTSGALVVARTQAVKATLGDFFRNRQVGKTYLALVCGAPEPPVGTLETLIGRHPVRRQRMAVRDEVGKRAVTHYRILAKGEGASLMGVRIETGRTHQIRVHLAHIRHPILGDRTYGWQSQDPVQPERQMLHAWKLSLPHPATHRVITFTAGVPADFQVAAAAVGINLAETLGADVGDGSVERQE